MYIFHPRSSKKKLQMYLSFHGCRQVRDPPRGGLQANQVNTYSRSCRSFYRTFINFQCSKRPVCKPGPNPHARQRRVASAFQNRISNLRIGGRTYFLGGRRGRRRGGSSGVQRSSQKPPCCGSTACQSRGGQGRRGRTRPDHVVQGGVWWHEQLLGGLPTCVKGTRGRGGSCGLQGCRGERHVRRAVNACKNNKQRATRPLKHLLQKTSMESPLVGTFF